VTVTKWTEPPNASFGRTRWAYSQELYQWSAEDVNADDSRIGLTGSRTTVYRIFSPKEASKKTRIFENDMGELVRLLGEAYARKSGATEEEGDKEPPYHLPEGKASSYSGDVWVYIEQEEGAINPASLELLGEATRLAGLLDEKVGAVLVGKNIKSLASELIGSGADKVYVAEDKLLEHFLPVPYTKAVSQLIERYRPQIVLFSATPLGRELSPRVAYRLKSGLTADCTRLDIMDFKKGKLELTAVLGQTRPAMGGNIMASIITQNSVVQMSTVRPGVMMALAPDGKRTGEIIEQVPGLRESDLGARIISSELYELTSDITEAVAIACGGAGCRTKDNFNKFIIPLAQSLGKFLGEKAIVAASRAAVELGFIDYSHQVGQTGQTVKPRVYVAVGVSGAVQHLTGMQNSDIVVAINSDPNAPIFQVADYGVVGNMEELVPQLIDALNSQGKSGE
jgi:electron transfer flavoprotein alpha subunit